MASQVLNTDETKIIQELYVSLKALVGLHRDFLETVRAERLAISDANLKLIQEITYKKAALIEAIRQREAERMKHTIGLAALWKKPLQQLTLNNLAIEIQGKDLKTADQLRSIQTVLMALIQRVSEQNKYNKELVDKSLEHIRQMKNNVLGEATPKSETYSSYGKKQNSGRGESRLLSKEI